MLLSRGIKLEASADHSLALILIQEGMEDIFLAHNCEHTDLEGGTGHWTKRATSLHAVGAHWGHRSETGAASGNTNGEEATGEEFFQQD